MGGEDVGARAEAEGAGRVEPGEAEGERRSAPPWARATLWKPSGDVGSAASASGLGSALTRRIVVIGLTLRECSGRLDPDAAGREFSKWLLLSHFGRAAAAQGSLYNAPLRRGERMAEHEDAPEGEGPEGEAPEGESEGAPKTTGEPVGGDVPPEPPRAGTAPGEPGEPAKSAEAPAEPEGKGERLLGVKVHNLIFVGMILGVILGIATFYLDHHDAIVLKGVAEPLEGEITSIGDADAGTSYVIKLTDGSQRSLEPSEVESYETTAYDDIVWWFNFFGTTIFMSALKMLIAPLIFASIVAGIVSLKGLDQLKRIGGKTLLYYCCSTLVAVSLGLVVVLTIRPGHKEASVDIRDKRTQQVEARQTEYATETGDPALSEVTGKPTADFRGWLAQRESEEAGTGDAHGTFERVQQAQGTTAGDILKNKLVKPMLTNPFDSLTNSNSLGIIVFALILGIFTVIIGEPARPVATFFISFNEVITRITKFLMNFAPFCVMCILAELLAKNGPNVFGSLAWYCITVIVGIALHVAFLFAIAYLIGGVTPLAFWRGISEAWMIAFTTRSSAATLPVTLRCVTEKLGVSPRVANFALPVGATMNMDGTALYEGVAVIFLIQIYGGMIDVPIELGGAVTLVIFITAVFASIGAAAVPDAGLVTMVLVATAVGLPVYYIPLIFAVDAFLDMFRTSTNILGDSTGCLIVQRLEDRSLAAA